MSNVKTTTTQTAKLAKSTKSTKPKLLITTKPKVVKVPLVPVPSIFKICKFTIADKEHMMISKSLASLLKQIRRVFDNQKFDKIDFVKDEQDMIIEYEMKPFYIKANKDNQEYEYIVYSDYLTNLEEYFVENGFTNVRQENHKGTKSIFVPFTEHRLCNNQFTDELIV
jgi:hypothetical protein